MVSALDYQPEGRWFKPGLCRCISLQPGVYMGTGDTMLGGEPGDGLASDSGGVCSNTLSRFMLWKLG